MTLEQLETEYKKDDVGDGCIRRLSTGDVQVRATHASTWLYVGQCSKATWNDFCNMYFTEMSNHNFPGWQDCL